MYFEAVYYFWFEIVFKYDVKVKTVFIILKVFGD